MIKKVIIVLLFVSVTPTIIKAQETTGSLYYSLGNDAMGIYNFEEAKKYFHLSIEQNEPEIVESMTDLCFCYQALNNYNESIKWGKKALLFDLTEWQKARVYLCLGKSYGFLEKFDTAFKYFEIMPYNIPNEFKFVKEGWYYITTSDYDNIYYNNKSVIRSGNGKIKVWLKWYWDEETMYPEDFIKIKSYGGEPDNLTSWNEAENRRKSEIMEERGNAKYTLTYKEYDFINYLTRFIEEIKYDKEGKVLTSVSLEKYKLDSWDNIVPGSVGETIFNFLKKKYHK